MSHQEAITITDRVVYVSVRDERTCTPCMKAQGQQHPAQEIPYPDPGCEGWPCRTRGVWHRVERDADGFAYVGAPLPHAPTLKWPEVACAP